VRRGSVEDVASAQAVALWATGTGVLPVESDIFEAAGVGALMGRSLLPPDGSEEAPWWLRAFAPGRAREFVRSRRAAHAGGWAYAMEQALRQAARQDAGVEEPVARSTPVFRQS